MILDKMGNEAVRRGQGRGSEGSRSAASRKVSYATEKMKHKTLDTVCKVAAANVGKREGDASTNFI